MSRVANATWARSFEVNGSIITYNAGKPDTIAARPAKLQVQPREEWPMEDTVSEPDADKTEEDDDDYELEDFFSCGRYLVWFFSPRRPDGAGREKELLLQYFTSFEIRRLPAFHSMSSASTTWLSSR